MSTIDEIRELLSLAHSDDRYLYQRYEITIPLRALIKTLDPADVDALLAITDDPEESDFRETIISGLVS